MSEKSLDKISLFMRRILIILILFLILYLVLFRRIWIWKKSKNTDLKSNDNQNINIEDSNSGDNIEITTVQSWTKINLWSKYESDWDSIFYRWERINFVNADEFVVLSKNEKKEIEWTLINSDNLLLAFQDYDTRLSMMKNIDGIISNEQNVTTVLKNSSENWMYKIKTDYEDLSQYNWKNQEWKLTPEQRAKFAMIYLYVKIIKNAKWTVYMEQALQELKDFIENFNETSLIPEVNDKNFKLKWDIWMDKHCIFVDGELYACFLDDLF